MKRILITGGAGFIGSHLCHHYLEKDYEVLCLDNLSTGSFDNISAFSNLPSFKFIEHDLTKPFKFNDKLDAILHFASPASPVDYQEKPIPTLKVGALGTHNALGLARAHQCKILLASTSEVYGDPQVHPQPETYWGHVNPIGPRGCYDEAKRFLEALTMAYHRTHGLDTRIIRIFNTYGPNMRIQDGRAIPTFISQALSGKSLTVHGQGDQTRSFCYIDDLVNGISRVLESNYHLPINLGNPQELSVLDCAKLIMNLTQSHSKIVFEERPIDDPHTRRPDINLAQKLLNWNPQFSLQQGLEKTIPYFKKKLINSSSENEKSLSGTKESITF
ncbi:MAG: SDR family oxidoreductase [Deltaproteobacteria bacterium]|nr:SDR family oxidoreductase [Deltaproteobacteria bacterium]